MNIFILAELNVFLQAAWKGMCIAFFYDGFRIVRRVVKHKDWIVGMEDYLFWVVTGFSVFSMLLKYNDGIARGYIMIALIIGGYMYEIAFSSWLVKKISKILNFILTFLLKKPLKWTKIVILRVWGVVMSPLKLILKLEKDFRKGVKKHGKYNDQKKEKGKISDIRH